MVKFSEKWLPYLKKNEIVFSFNVYQSAGEQMLTDIRE